MIMVLLFQVQRLKHVQFDDVTAGLSALAKLVSKKTEKLEMTFLLVKLACHISSSTNLLKRQDGRKQNGLRQRARDPL